MSSFDEQKINDLLPVRDEIRDIARDLPLFDKNYFLEEAANDPVYGPAIEVHGMLQETVNELGRILARRSGIIDREFPLSMKDFGIDHMRNHSDEIIHIDEKLRQSDPQALARSIEKRLIHEAHLAAAEHESYRRYGVGARIFCFDAKTGRIGIFSGANRKHHELEPAYCAERVAFDKAEQNDFDNIAAIYVSAEPQFDADAGKQFDIQPPCGPCRLEIYTNPRIAADTPIICVNRKGMQTEYIPEELLLLDEHRH